jgi:hypothetical protein
MSGTVLRGDYTRLRRRGDRVWIRVRPYELIWRTTHSFTVDDVRAIDIEAIRFERRRHRPVVGSGASRVVEPGITRVTFEYGTGDHASVDLHETEATVVAAFQDVVDRLVVDDGPPTDVAPGRDAPDRDEQDGPEPIHWRADRDPEFEGEPEIDLRVEQGALWEDDPLARELTEDVLFKLDLGADPHSVRRWILRQLHDAAGDEATSALGDDWLDAQELPGLERAPGEAVWVRKRRRRVLRALRRFSSR